MRCASATGTPRLVLARRMAELAPASDYLAWRHAFHAVRNNRPREAIAALEPFDPDKGWHKDRSNYWETLDEAFHLAGEYTKELTAARRGCEDHREWWYLRGRELNALAALGKVPEIRAQLDTIRASQPPGDALHFLERAAPGAPRPRPYGCLSRSRLQRAGVVGG